jgi:anti-anti-sigma regulatory factor
MANRCRRPHGGWVYDPRRRLAIVHAAGQTTVVRPTGVGRHLCWAFADRANFLDRARAFLAEGRAAGERLWLIGDDLPALDGVSSVPLREIHPAGYALATTAALADGYTGLRVAVDATPLVRQRAAFVADERLVDRYLADHPFSVLCGFDVRVLGAAAVAELACAHAAHNVAEVPFRLHGTPGSGGVALSGEVDGAGAALLSRALDRAAPPVVDGEVVVDGAGLEFIDHRSLLGLADYARGRGATAVLRTPLPAAARLADLLRVPGIRVEAR